MSQGANVPFSFLQMLLSQILKPTWHPKKSGLLMLRVRESCNLWQGFADFYVVHTERRCSSSPDIAPAECEEAGEEDDKCAAWLDTW